MKETVMKNQQAIREALEAICRRDGKLKPEAVVEAAKDPASPLHARFEWDDGKAAQEHRLWRRARRGQRLSLLGELRCRTCVMSSRRLATR